MAKTVIQIQHSLSAKQAIELNTLIAAHVAAQIADFWSGGGPSTRRSSSWKLRASSCLISSITR